MGVVAILTALGIGLFYKELLVSSFDPGLAHATGIRADWIHYGLMIWLSVVVVSAFESVGAILVIAMLILPGASASLLSQRLHIMLAWPSLHALSSLIGLHLAIWWTPPSPEAWSLPEVASFSKLADQPKPGTSEEASEITINGYKSCSLSASVEEVFLGLLGIGGLLGLLGCGRVLFPGSRHLLLSQFMDQKFHSQIGMLRTAYRRL